MPVRRPGGEDTPHPLAVPPQKVRELLDPYSERTMIIESGQVLVIPEKVLLNVRQRMERIDLDPTTSWTMNDVMSTEEMAVLFVQLHHGPMVVTSTAEHARQILGRWPHHLVAHPIPPTACIEEFLTDLTSLSRASQNRARLVINRALQSPTEVLSHPELQHLDPHELMETWVSLIFWFAIKSGFLNEH